MSNLAMFKKRSDYQVSFKSIFDDYLVDSLLEETNLYQNKADFYWDEEKQEYSIYIEAPGFSKEDIKIEYDSKGLNISGELKNEGITKRFGKRKISYIFSNDEIDPETIVAELKDGILFLTMKKLKDKKTKFINII